MIAGKPNTIARKEARESPETPDVKHRAVAMSLQLSGGSAFQLPARSSTAPVILADQPAARLDDIRAVDVVDLRNSIACQFDTTIIVMTNDEKVIPTSRRLYNIRDGITFEKRSKASRKLELPDTLSWAFNPRSMKMGLGPIARSLARAFRERPARHSSIQG